jgi:hypothetical protein
VCSTRCGLSVRREWFDAVNMDSGPAGVSRGGERAARAKRLGSAVLLQAAVADIAYLVAVGLRALSRRDRS